MDINSIHSFESLFKRHSIYKSYLMLYNILNHISSVNIQNSFLYKKYLCDMSDGHLLFHIIGVFLDKGTIFIFKASNLVQLIILPCWLCQTHEVIVLLSMHCAFFYSFSSRFYLFNQLYAFNSLKFVFGAKFSSFKESQLITNVDRSCV